MVASPIPMSQNDELLCMYRSDVILHHQPMKRAENQHTEEDASTSKEQGSLDEKVCIDRGHFLLAVQWWGLLKIQKRSGIKGTVQDGKRVTI